MTAAKILVVDDERIVGTAIKNELENFGYTCSGIASSADEAVDKAVQGRPDLILMDIHLKGEKDGIAAAREIRRRFRIPVVFLSAFADPETVARAGETEPFGYLVKPYEEQELQTTIEMALAKRRSEQRLEETDRWLAAILEGVDDAVIASDAANRTRFMNLAGEALTGWRKGDGVGKPLAAICTLVAVEGRVALETMIERAISESRTLALPSTTRLVSRDGRETPIEGCLSPIHDEQGEFLGMTLSIRDISARLELERVKRLNEEQTRQSQKMEAVRRLAGGMAHHLNNLLTVILGNTALALARPADEDETKAALGRVDTAGRRAADLIQRLLNFSGRGPGQLRQVDLNTMLSECLNKIKPLFEPRINVVCRPGLDLWPVTADEVQVGQAILNLCLNAQDAMPDEGQLTLESANVVLTAADLANHPGARLGKFVRLRISDTGQGMTPEVCARIFEPFFTTKETGQGIGLGLAFVFSVVEQHHGWIECKSEVGQGTRFDLYFPSFGLDTSVESTPVMRSRPRGAKPTILLAEAEPMVRDFGRLILVEQGYQVLVAEDGVQAVEVFRQAHERIDLVILDLNLPRLSGDAILERLLELDPNVEVFFSSGYLAEDRCQGGSHLLGVISKPYSRQELVKMVQLALARRSEAGL